MRVLPFAISAVGATALLALSATVRAEPAAEGSAAVDDLRPLRGQWIERERDFELNLLFDEGRNVSFAVSSSGRRGRFARTAVGRIAEVGRDDHGAYFELDPWTAEAAALPGRLYYRLDGQELAIEIGDGPMAGRHVLGKGDAAGGPDWSARPSRLGLAVAAATVIAVLLAMIGVAVWYYRSLRQKT